MTINETIKKIGYITLLSASIVGGITLSEKSGLTDLFVDYNHISCLVYESAHEKAPYLFWTDAGPCTKERKIDYRIGVDVEVGLLALFLVGLGHEYFSIRRKEYIKRKK